MKKTFIASIIFFLIAILALGYFIFIRKSSTTSSSHSQIGSSLPFGTPSSIGLNQQEGGGETNGPGSPGSGRVVLARLMQLSNGPVAGAGSFTIGSTTIVRYAAKGTGYVTEVNLTYGTTSELVNTTFSKIYESIWGNNATTVLLRSADESNADTITSYSAVLTPSYSSGNGTSSQTSFALLGTYLPTNIESLAVSPDTKKIAYAVPTTASGEEIQTSNTDGSKASTLFNSSFGEWTIGWPQANIIALTTKPSSGVAGYMFFVNLKTNLMKKVLDGITGLVAVANPTADHVAYSDDGLNLQIEALNTKTATSTNLNTHLQTLADKCAWSYITTTMLYCGVPISLQPTSYPDSWYQGLVSFTDSIYEINGTTGTSTLLADIHNLYKKDLDIMSPFVTSDGKYIIFTNKNDYTLWSFRISATD